MSQADDRPLVAVLDYGIGNLRSAQKALEHVGDQADVGREPGVGAFGACMRALDASGLAGVAYDAAFDGRPFLGICVGMQLLFDASEEDPDVAGLGVVHGTIRWIPPGVKRPQMQWNVLDVRQPADPLLADLGREPWVYFVHSLHGVPDDPSVVAATCEYGATLTAAIRQGTVFATQFHPEKSARAGLTLLGSFTRVAARARAGQPH